MQWVGRSVYLMANLLLVKLSIAHTVAWTDIELVISTAQCASGWDPILSLVFPIMIQILLILYARLLGSTTLDLIIANDYGTVHKVDDQEMALGMVAASVPVHLLSRSELARCS